MHKLFGKRGFAVFTSLALCVSLVAPSFAASFTDLQNVIDNKTSLRDDEGNDRIGYDKDTDTVKLHEDVKREAGEEGLKVGTDKNVTLDLNGNSVDYGRDGVAANRNGVHSTVQVEGSLTIKDTSSEATGKITGGWDSGVKVTNGGNLTLESGSITGNATGHNGGGVNVDGGSFTMNGGKVSGNESGNTGITAGGGGVSVAGGGSFTMNGGEISGNTAANGGGVYVTNGSATINGGKVSDNEAQQNGGGVGARSDNASVEMNGGEVSGNTSASSGGGGGGVWVKEGASFTMTDGKISGNTAGNGGSGGGVGVHQGSFTMTGGEISGNSANDGRVDGVQVHGSSSQGNGSFTMSGGTIKGDVTVKNEGDKSSTSLTGGTFSELLGDEYLAEGYAFLANEDGTYSVVDHSDHIWTEWMTISEAEIGVPGAQERFCRAEGCDGHEIQEIPALEPAPVVVVPTDPSLYVSDEPTIEIDDPTVPLAEGPVTCGEFVDYLWRHEGEPEVEVVGDHEYAPAISWAHSIEIIPDDGFDPDELVTVAFVRDILANFAVYSDMVMPELTTLKGDEDEAVLNCHEVLAEFYSAELTE
ncbi:MAG: hypothetical protein HDT38_05640 [Clostridiales bacterium]|nr:hypothetical protein [Clostridiales bacterium]